MNTQNKPENNDNKKLEFRALTIAKYTLIATVIVPFVVAGVQHCVSIRDGKSNNQTEATTVSDPIVSKADTTTPKIETPISEEKIEPIKDPPLINKIEKYEPENPSRTFTVVNSDSLDAKYADAVELLTRFNEMNIVGISGNIDTEEVKKELTLLIEELLVLSKKANNQKIYRWAKEVKNSIL